MKILKVSALKTDHLETIMVERDKTGTKIWNAMLCLLGLSVIHFCAFLVWVGGTTERLAAYKEVNTAQDAAISRLEHGTKP